MAREVIYRPKSADSWTGRLLAPLTVRTRRDMRSHLASLRRQHPGMVFAEQGGALVTPSR